MLESKPYEWNKYLQKQYDDCPGHEQMIDIDGGLCFCDECHKPICIKCGLCFGEPQLEEDD